MLAGRGFLKVAGVALISLLLAGLMAASASAAQPPYEPNDSLLTAYGPLTINQTYTAAIETENDLDYFYFYVTTPSTAQVTITLKSLGGPENAAGTYLGLENAQGDGIGEDADVGQAGQTSTINQTLSAGKYLVKVGPNGRYGASYSFTTAGTEGAFGEYAPIAAQCAAATAGVSAIQAPLATAQAKFKKAGQRLRHIFSLHSSRARRRVRASYVKARAGLKAEEAAMKAATAAQKPWCFIPA